MALEYFDVEKDEKDLERMLTYTGGQREVPVIVKGSEVTVGFGGT